MLTLVDRLSAVVDYDMIPQLGHRPMKSITLTVTRCRDEGTIARALQEGVERHVPGPFRRSAMGRPSGAAMQ